MSGDSKPEGGKDHKQESKQDLAVDRTDLAEDRTVLANERTFAGWFRTGFASVAIGLGFNALFVRMEPWWAPRAIATLFLFLAIGIFIAAERRACQVFNRLSTHEIKTFRRTSFRVMVGVASVGVLALMAAMWLLPLEPK